MVLNDLISSKENILEGINILSKYTILYPYLEHTPVGNLLYIYLMEDIHDKLLLNLEYDKLTSQGWWYENNDSIIVYLIYLDSEYLE